MLTLRMHPMGGVPVGHLNEFLEWWYGPPARVLGRVASAPVPTALAEWYAAEQAWDRRLALQNRVLAASELATQDGFTRFYVENQDIWHWAFGMGADPEVFDRENEPGVPWLATGAKLSRFLVHAAMFEATFASRVSATAIDIDRTHYDRVVNPLVAVAMTPWNWPGPDSRLFYCDRILAFGGVNDRPGTPVTAESLYHVNVAARSNDDLAYLDEIDISWAYNTRLFGEGVYP